jgi:hypothetical protein
VDKNTLKFLKLSETYKLIKTIFWLDACGEI